jgi:iron complex outermembrane receptor protein
MWPKVGPTSQGVRVLVKHSLVPVSLVWALAAASASATAAPADTPAPATETAPIETVDKHDIVVIADRIKGQVDAPQPPVAVFNEEDIAAYGVSSITDLLTAISPQTGSGRGRGATMPIILVNGQRISSFREMRDFPPEAIRKVEVLPEEVALRYGYSPDSRVVNFVLKDHFLSRAAEIEFTHPDGGGSNTTKGSAQVLKIDMGRRYNLTARTDHTTPTTEADHNVVAVDGNTAASPYRTLVADSKNYSLNGTMTVPVGKDGTGGNFTVNGTATRADTASLSGLSALSTPLTKVSRTDTYQAGTAFNKPLGTWQLTATADTTHTEATTTSALYTIPVGGAGATVAQTNTDAFSSLVTLNGRPFALPAGKAGFTIKGGFAYSALRGTSTSVGAVSSSLKRGDASVGVNLALPITSTREHVGEAIGDLTANISGGADRLSDFGWLGNYSAGLTWNITKKFGVQTSYVYSEAAPSLSALGAPQTTTFNVSTYDFRTGQTVLATIISGGNPALLRERRNDIKIGLNWTPPILSGAANLVVEYFNNRSNNVTSSFPTVLTPALEAAYAGRVTRNSLGQLTQIDRRSVTLAEQREERVRWGFNVGGPLGKEIKTPPRGPMAGLPGGRPPGGFGAPPPGGARMGGAGGPPPGGGAPGGGPGGPPGPNGQRFEGRWNLSLYHTVQFVDRVQLSQGGPVLNLLGGDALSGGGVARHSLELEGGSFYKGIGLRLNGTWSAPTHITSTTAASSDLRFGALFKMNGRIFIDLGQQASLANDAPGLFKGARLSFYANNLFDQRQKVTDAKGATPLSYQPALMDANGRILGVEYRKTF